MCAGSERASTSKTRWRRTIPAEANPHSSAARDSPMQILRSRQPAGKRQAASGF
jgi:hypothetical protein